MERFSFLLALAVAMTSQVCAARESIISGEQASRHVHVLTRGIKWHTSLEDAQNAAKERGALIFWVHMLGKIDGKT
ncbi:MAG TPA: hypothetical protein V6D08_01240 [Candidatus Obscuribacterales bacterium]